MMKKSFYCFIALVTVFLILSSVTLQAQTLIDQWGKTNRGTAWPILNTATTPAGEAGIGSGAHNTAWSTIRGGFNAVEATTAQAVVVSGQMELVGGNCGSSYTHLRYAFTFQDSIALNYQYTDSAKWITTGTTEHGHFGYEFTPRTGTGTIANGSNGVGTVWTVPNTLGWNSTYSGQFPLITVRQAPRNAEMIAGLYNWAISVQPLADGTNEIRWKMIEQNNKYYYAGIVIDTAQISTQFNGVCFGFGSDEDFEATQVNFTGVQVELGAPIDIPEAPWEPFYVDQWGKTNRGTSWPILNDSTQVAGEASIGSGAHNTAWSTIRGGFGETIQATTTRAIIVSGQMQLNGNCGSSYTHLRYALTFQDSIALNYQFTDSARWITTDTSTAENGHFGYEFTPRTGTGTLANGSNGVGTVWTVPNTLGWNSTYSGQFPLITVRQAPRNAEMIAGLYNWAISVQPLADGTNEIRWKMVEQNNKYWFAGTVIDPDAISSKFNGICFGFGSDEDFEATQVNFYEVTVDMGAPIDIPEAPWEPFYVDQWGKTNRGTNWPILNDSTQVAGEASIGSGTHNTAWSTIRGGFGETIQATTTRAIIVSGQMQLNGNCGSSYTHLRYALTFQDSIKLVGQYQDTARWVKTGRVERGHFGYEFTPRTGTGTLANGSNGVGTVWTVPNTLGWNSTYSGQFPLITVRQAPRNAEMIAGIYNWAISVQPLGDGTNEIRWKMVDQNNKYWFAGIVIDPDEISSKFNGVCFGFGSDEDFEATQVNFYEVTVDMGAPIDIPEAPWEPYYVSDWGFSGGNLGGWDLTPGVIVGSVTISGTAAPTGWAAVSGGLGEPYVLTPVADRALKITGQLQLVGGGFEDLASLRYGLFYSDSAGTLTQDSTLDSNWVWNGTDGAHSGYLFVPPSGTNIASWSGTAGTWGAIANDTWWDIDGSNNFPLGAPLQTPADAVAGPGMYDFAISISPQSIGNIVKTTLSKRDSPYYYEVSGIYPVTATTNKINYLAFAINNSTTTALNLYEVQVDRGPHIPTGITNEEPKQLPTVYSLNQNYPNPFNPTTTIEFALPQSGDVNLVVYDISGRVVTQLASGHFNAGYHKITFDAGNLASGIYLYRLEAGNFVSVKKLVLLK